MPRAHESRRVFLKFRVKPLVRMPKSVLFAKIRQSCKHGVVADDLEIMTLQWGHGWPRGGHRYTAGQELSGDDATELENAYDLLTAFDKSDVRFEKPDR